MTGQKKIGEWGEYHAARFFREKGFCIESSNFRSRMGEIDLIVTNQKWILFVEVKTRTPEMLAAPREAVDRLKQNRIQTAMYYLRLHKNEKRQPRFDVVEVTMEKGSFASPKSINHIENAFDLEGFHATI